MSAYTLGLVGAVITIVVIFEMLRRRKLREKYALLWVLLAAVMATIALVPDVLAAAARVTGVQVPANLLFFVGSLVLVAVNIQLSSEIGRLEERTRTLAEQVALLRLESPGSGRPRERARTLAGQVALLRRESPESA